MSESCEAEGRDRSVGDNGDPGWDSEQLGLREEESGSSGEVGDQHTDSIPKKIGRPRKYQDRKISKTIRITPVAWRIWKEESAPLTQSEWLERYLRSLRKEE